MNGNMAYLASNRGCRAQSHKRCYKSNFSSIPEFQDRNRDSRRVKDSATLSKGIRRKVLMIQAGPTANVTYCIIAVEFYKHFLQMEGYLAHRLKNVNNSEAKDYIFYGR